MKQDNRSTQLETDYLIIGSGAAGMAFADTLLTETNSSIVIVDRNDQPGGHWVFAYPFVKLHQSSAYYGVNSKELSKGIIDQVGFNKGLMDLATGQEILAYYHDLMQYTFLPSGRVKYYPMCEYQGSGCFKSILTGEVFEVKVNKKTVDATHLKTKIPATHTPGFDIAPGSCFIPVNDLPRIKTKPAGFVVIGGGKTAIDACLWLLEHRIDPDLITWIRPRDAWLLDRKNYQLDDDSFEYFLRDQAHQFESLAVADSIPDLFDRLEKGGCLLRIDKKVTPTMYCCATISREELKQLRRIKNVIRKGRVKRIEENQIVLDKGILDTTPGHVHVDCSASGLSYPELKPVFDDRLITIQTVRSCQPAFSSAFIAHIEAAFDDETFKNELCTVIPLPNRDIDWIKMMSVRMKNQFNWNNNEVVLKWLQESRLEGGFTAKVARIPEDHQRQQELLGRIRQNIEPAMSKLQLFIRQLHQ